ncbi:coiled-coil protein [Legionella nautarum]|uniref:Coiled-coil protein n=1 Tax=Legionella nautarum TaxID=45070 RepID=A0A0W0WLD8_9GAMM|nr:primosomal replication protein PriC [Legionella nautarum]KTD33128.1 coiled-coil protein [Legionella nautarum]
MDYRALLQELTARLPELEWKISALEGALSMHSLPRGLFRPRLEVTAASCIEEIKADIRTLAEQKMASSAYYLAQRIQQKINVLVTLCHLQSSKPKNEKKPNFGLNSISTRQQWLQSLEQDINRLTEQQEAMSKALRQMQTRGDSQAVLQLNAELGEIEKRLTLAKETFARA